MPKIDLRYFGYHPYNNPTRNERNIELPIAFWFLEKFRHDQANVIEVGEVTPFYRIPEHPVYDPGAEKPGTIKNDALAVDYRGKHLLCISTIEHIGTSDYGQTANPDLLPAVIEKMLSSRNYLITFALGYNAQLDSLVANHRYLVIERIARTRWRQIENRGLGDYKYNSPWGCGNAICVLTNLDDLRFEFSRRNLFTVLRRCRTPGWSWRSFAKAVLRDELVRKAAA